MKLSVCYRTYYGGGAVNAGHTTKEFEIDDWEIRDGMLIFLTEENSVQRIFAPGHWLACYVVEGHCPDAIVE